MKYFKFFAVFYFLLQLTGCSASGSLFQQLAPSNDEVAVVYLFRQSSFVGGATCPDVHVNGEMSGCLKMGGYLRFELPPGNNTICFCRTIWEVGNDLSMNLHLKRGEVRYFEWVPLVPDMAFIGANVVVTGGDMEDVIEHKPEGALKILASSKHSI